MLFDLANLPYWIFLGIGILLFLLVIVSGAGNDDLDTDVEIEVEADFDSGTFDPNADAELEFTPLQILGWLGIGKTPLILLLAIDFSSWRFIGWLLNTIII